MVAMKITAGVEPWRRAAETSLTAPRSDDGLEHDAHQGHGGQRRRLERGAQVARVVEQSPGVHAIASAYSRIRPASQTVGFGASRTTPRLPGLRRPTTPSSEISSRWAVVLEQ